MDYTMHNNPRKVIVSKTS